MTATARQVIAGALIEWLEESDITRFTEVQRLENATSIWEYGKWCARGGKHRLGVMPQIDYREAPDWESDTSNSGWDAIPDISDEEGMRIHETTLGLDSFQLSVLERVYERWQPPHVAIEQMRVSASTFYRARKAALEFMETRLKNPIDTMTQF